MGVKTKNQGDVVVKLQIKRKFEWRNGSTKHGRLWETTVRFVFSLALGPVEAKLFWSRRKHKTAAV